MSSAKPLPSWAQELASLYESHAASQFILSGNVHDRFLVPQKQGKTHIGSLTEYVQHVLVPGFDVVITYDLGNGIRIERGQEVFTTWPAYKDRPELPKTPLPAVETLTRYFRYAANLRRLGKEAPQIACIVRSAHLVAPATQGSTQFDLGAVALLMREWAEDPLLVEHPLVTCLIADNLHDLHPLLANNARAPRLTIPMPDAATLAEGVEALGIDSAALGSFKDDLPALSRGLVGASFHAVERMLRLAAHQKDPIEPADLSRLKKQMVENDCGELIEFIQSTRTLDDVHGNDGLKTWLRQDIALWNKNELAALPMGYLICGPVGTGKTYLAECLAGEAGAPVVKLKNFRDKWVGSTEGNLEKIFRLLQALERCYVFVDEADQTLGKRDSGSNDSGLSGRVYSMLAQEMSRSSNRGRIIWLLASSRPDLIEVDLKRPGRVDVKIPLFPTANTRESFDLIKALCKRRKIMLEDASFPALESHLPTLLTPGAAEAIAVKCYRLVQTRELAPEEALREALYGYQPPVPLEIIEQQIRIAVQEATDLSFVPEVFRQAS
ncbi:MAG: ATP-binding protein [Verrucomicrobiaceae bacterium]|nr:ATP-binding protein [Verrucomicrobiaceae bacterium]